MAGLASNADLAAVGFDDCLGNRQAHAGALNLQALISTAIEFFEYSRECVPGQPESATLVITMRFPTSPVI